MRISTPPNKLERSVGDALKRARVGQGFTLADLSGLSGVSSAMISKIERGQVSASLSTLDALAHGIGMPIANFFAETVERKEVSFVKSGAGIEVRRVGSTYGHDYRLIGRAVTAGAQVECYIISLANTADGQPFFQHPGIEFIQLLDGQMSYQIGEQVYTLAPGDALTFDSEMPHGPVSLSAANVTFLTVILAGPE